MTAYGDRIRRVKACVSHYPLREYKTMFSVALKHHSKRKHSLNSHQTTQPTFLTACCTRGELKTTSVQGNFHLCFSNIYFLFNL